jgi:hypothetical protein
MMNMWNKRRLIKLLNNYNRLPNHEQAARYRLAREGVLRDEFELYLALGTNFRLPWSWRISQLWHSKEGRLLVAYSRQQSISELVNDCVEVGYITTSTVLGVSPKTYLRVTAKGRELFDWVWFIESFLNRYSRVLILVSAFVAGVKWPSIWEWISGMMARWF